jgi:hypothetical protein
MQFDYLQNDFISEPAIQEYLSENSCLIKQQHHERCIKRCKLNLMFHKNSNRIIEYLPMKGETLFRTKQERL